MISLNSNIRLKSYDLLIYEALIRSLEESRIDSFIISKYRKNKAGYDGERNVDYKLSAYPLKNCIIIKGIRLPISSIHFQIDTLLLTKNLIVVLEIKNSKGTLHYDSKQRQLTQELNGKMAAQKDPILQAEAQKNHLQEFLGECGIFGIPIETLVVVAYPTTIINNIHKDPGVYKKFIHNESLHIHLDRLFGLYPNEAMPLPMMHQLGNNLLKNDTPLRSDILKLHGLHKTDFRTGVPCAKCNFSQMVPIKYSKWGCPKCDYTETDAHVRRILDYFLLFGDTLTNRECREFLQIESPRTAYRILNSMNLKFAGNNSARKYFAPSLADFPQKSPLPDLSFKSLHGDYAY
ncbi:nuclease-related domain-containing protein [Virgibacillus ihumii]|uniref:nuclease-related domain-containing protein n=1 Tax=Virgibacillus ihumii TaxID=2686091 RepID=UPI00157DE841|nr:nuclease-related domain-containing protein [Virgibacillus ihumii]